MLTAKRTSFSTQSIIARVRREEDAGNISHDEIRGFVVCIYGNEWWLGCVLQLNGDDVRVNFLHPHGPSPSFSYPHHPDILTVSVEDVLLCASASKSNYNRTSAPKGLSEHSMLCLGNEKQ